MKEAQKGDEKISAEKKEFIVNNFTLPSLTTTFFLEQGMEISPSEVSAFQEITPEDLQLKRGNFILQYPSEVFEVRVQQKGPDLHVTCNCDSPGKKLCIHQAQVLLFIRNRKEIRIFFDEALRKEAIRKVAVNYGLEKEEELDDFSHWSTSITTLLK